MIPEKQSACVSIQKHSRPGGGAPVEGGGPQNGGYRAANRIPFDVISSGKMQKNNQHLVTFIKIQKFIYFSVASAVRETSVPRHNEGPL